MRIWEEGRRSTTKTVSAREEGILNHRGLNLQKEKGGDEVMNERKRGKREREANWRAREGQEEEDRE